VNITNTHQVKVQVWKIKTRNKSKTRNIWFFPVRDGKNGLISQIKNKNKIQKSPLGSEKFKRNMIVLNLIYKFPRKGVEIAAIYCWKRRQQSDLFGLSV